MMAASGQSGLLVLWVTFTAAALVGMIAVLVWAVRSGQFSHQDRARRLPLDSGIPDDSARAEGDARGRRDCLACHGPAGDGEGPVGQSYVPFPADLRSAKVQGYADGQLLRVMLSGEGHSPVLERTVLSDHRWYLVLHVRGLGASVPAGGP